VVSAEVEFDWATVGNTHNANDIDEGGIGRVDYEYRISKHEVTNAQYAEFLGKVASADPNGLFNASMDITQSGVSGGFTYAVNAGFEDHPVNYVSFFDAMRFVNWLDNGQGSGGTESGVYSIGTGANEVRAPDATYFLPSDSEWYKAAYYDPTLNNGAGGYWKYPTRSNTQPTSETPPGGVNSANLLNSGVGDTAGVGSYPDATSFYGAFDMAGNVWEWNEEIGGSHPFRRYRGASWVDHVAFTASVSHLNSGPASAASYLGFRVATVPEPCSMLIVSLGMLGLLKRKRRAG